MKQITSLLVGDHFVPPAKLLLQHLASGCGLILEPDDANPYDEEAVVVSVDCQLIPDSQFPALEEALPAMGFTLEQIMSGGTVRLGHVASSAGKPLAKARQQEPELVGNHQFREGMLDSGHRASLAFGPDGKARVVLEYGE